MKKTIEKELTLKFTILQLFFWVGFCSVFIFTPVYLLSKNFKNSEIGLVLALANIIAVFLQPLCASLIDRYQKITVKSSLLALIAVIVLSSFLIIVFNDNFYVISLSFILIMTSIQSTQPLMYSLFFEYINKGININFGLARGLGSLSFAITSLTLGNLISKLGADFLPYFYIFIMILVLALIFLFKSKNEDYINDNFEIKNYEESTSNLSLYSFLLKNQKFAFLLLGFTFIFFTHSLLGSFMIQIMKNVGGDSSSTGMAFAIAAGIEVPVMAFFYKISNKISYGNTIKISAVFFTIKFLVISLATNVNTIYMAQILQFGAYALFLPASVYYVNAIMPDEDKIRGQALMASVGTLGTIFGVLIGGVLLGINIKLMFILGLAISLIGSIIVLFSVEKS